MKKIVCSILAASCLFSAAYSQDFQYKKRPAFGLHVFGDDFITPARIQNSSLHDVLRDHQWAKFNQHKWGMGINYMQGLTNHLDFSTSLGMTFLDYPMKDRPAPTGSNQNMLVEWDAMAYAKMLTDKYWVTPYLSGGIGASAWNGYYGAIMPLGGGLQVNIKDELFILLNSQYRVGITNTTADHFYHSLGFAANVGKKKEPKKVAPPPPPVVQEEKIPDTDGDGINDKEDKCPTVPGIARYQGCPIPDSDNDGVNDEEDKCKDIPGLARYQGCPIPDRDADGVNDEEDRCPDVAGPATNGGCPVLETAKFNTNDIQFISGSATLTEGAKRALNAGAKLLTEQYPQVKVEIGGHTDNAGKPDANQKLSAKRAVAVMSYLISRGVSADRLSAVGYGDAQPIADNKTKEGRARNRRVEFKVSQ
jgi:OOP family OmpA-OmpF porin